MTTSDIVAKLWNLCNVLIHQQAGDASDREKPLQTLIENNLDALLGIRLAYEGRGNNRG